jgi:hypothetical protein
MNSSLFSRLLLKAYAYNSSLITRETNLYRPNLRTSSIDLMSPCSRRGLHIQAFALTYSKKHLFKACLWWIGFLLPVFEDGRNFAEIHSHLRSVDSLHISVCDTEEQATAFRNRFGRKTKEAYLPVVTT